MNARDVVYYNIPAVISPQNNHSTVNADMLRSHSVHYTRCLPAESGENQIEIEENSI